MDNINENNELGQNTEIEESGLNSFFCSIYSWISIGLLISTAAFFLSNIGLNFCSKSVNLTIAIVFFILLIASTALIFKFLPKIGEFPFSIIILIYVLFASLFSIDLAALLNYFEWDLFLSYYLFLTPFLLNAFIFAAMAIYGKITKSDISKTRLIITIIIISLLIGWGVFSIPSFIIYGKPIDWILPAIVAATFSYAIISCKNGINGMMEVVVDKESWRRTVIISTLVLYGEAHCCVMRLSILILKLFVKLVNLALRMV